MSIKMADWALTVGSGCARATFGRVMVLNPIIHPTIKAIAFNLLIPSAPKINFLLKYMHRGQGYDFTKISG
jgi:hypothetical protein